MRNKQFLVWLAAGAMLLSAVVLALLRQPRDRNPLKGGAFSDAPNESGTGQSQTGEVASAIIPKNAPVVVGFVGDLLRKGNPQDDGTLEPYVVGDTIELEAETLNAVEYRWTVNGEVLKEKGQEWSTVPKRFYDFARIGPLNFTVQVRGADPGLLSQPKSTSLSVLPLKIMKFSKSILHDDDEHFLTGDTIFLQVEMAMAVGADPDYYRYRYFVNDVPTKHPDDEEEWTSEDMLPFVFPTPGNYSFKVEVRRATENKPEDVMELPETVIAADAVLLSFDSRPDNDKGSNIGTPVDFSAFPTSVAGKSECRFGVKKINIANYTWLPEDNGTIWGEDHRQWVPTEPGTYLIRCEIRELGKEVADDFREMYYTVTDGNF